MICPICVIDLRNILLVKQSSVGYLKYLIFSLLIKRDDRPVGINLKSERSSPLLDILGAWARRVIWNIVELGLRHPITFEIYYSWADNFKFIKEICLKVVRNRWISWPDHQCSHPGLEWPTIQIAFDRSRISKLYIKFSGRIAKAIIVQSFISKLSIVGLKRLKIPFWSCLKAWYSVISTNKP